MKYEDTFSYDRYDIHILADDSSDLHGFFELMAICQRTNKRTGITCLDFVVQEFVHPILPGEEVADAHYICNVKNKFEALVAHAIALLEDYQWVARYLEPILDMDRKIKEWT